MSYHAKVIKGGKIVIPAEFRHALGFAEGDSIVVDREGDTVVLKSQASMLKDIRAKVKSRLKKPLTLQSYLDEKWSETDNG